MRTRLSDDGDADRGERPAERKLDVEAVADEQHGDGLAEDRQPAQQNERADAHAAGRAPEAGERRERQAGLRCQPCPLIAVAGPPLKGGCDRMAVKPSPI